MDDVVYQAQSLIDTLAGSLGSSILHTHPNDLGAGVAEYLDGYEETSGRFKIHPSWSSWWNWAYQDEKQWTKLIKEQCYINASSGGSEKNVHCIPGALYDLLSEANCHSLPRFRDVTSLLRLPREEYANLKPSTKQFKLNPASNLGPIRTKHPLGMSMKKEHEVTRMTSCVAQTLQAASNALGIEVRHIVDIGSGQGYLSCSLADLSWSLEHSQDHNASFSPNTHVLGLDSSSEQIKGAERRATARGCKKQKTSQAGHESESDGHVDNFKSTLTFRTVWLGEAPTHESHPGQFIVAGSKESTHGDLEDVVDDWLAKLHKSESDANVPPDAIPVAFVALHACGTLTPNILRKALQLRRERSRSLNRSWFVAAVIVVGCCYNLLEEQDFPLSNSVADHIENNYPNFKLTYGHLQLAAQVPSEWLRDKEAEARAELAIKKVLYRALITPALVCSDDETAKLTTSGYDKTKRRIGKLNDKAYTSFETFLAVASKKLGFDLSEKLSSLITMDPRLLVETKIARLIEVLQTLRCALGPAMESLIILDRIIWLWESVDVIEKTNESMDIELVNVFDQSTDSGRNIAIVMYEGCGAKFKK